MIYPYHFIAKPLTAETYEHLYMVTVKEQSTNHSDSVPTDSDCASMLICTVQWSWPPVTFLHREHPDGNRTVHITTLPTTNVTSRHPGIELAERGGLYNNGYHSAVSLPRCKPALSCFLLPSSCVTACHKPPCKKRRVAAPLRSTPSSKRPLKAEEWTEITAKIFTNFSNFSQRHNIFSSLKQII